MATGGINVFIKRLNERAHYPEFATIWSSGADLFACLEEHTAVMKIPPGCWMLIPTGWAMEIPEGYEGQIRPRSGLAFKAGVTVLNSPGTIDSDYRGEVKVMLINHGERTFEVRHGDRIAQLVISTIPPVTYREVERELSQTERGGGGFGSTGK